MDFSKIKELTIPEGKVKSLSIGGVNVWKKNSNQYIIPAGTYVYKESGETVIIETAQIVSKEYHEWFSANVEEFNYIIPAGTYTFKDEQTIPESLASSVINISFRTAGQVSGSYTSYNYIKFSDGTIQYGINALSYTTVYNDKWVLERYKTAELTEDANTTRDFYYWFMESTTPKIELITFTIDGTIYQAKNGMTWSEWVNSSYNTDSYYIFNGDYICITKDSSTYRVYVDIPVVKTEQIISNRSYELDMISGGSS